MILLHFIFNLVTLLIDSNILFYCVAGPNNYPIKIDYTLVLKEYQPI